MGKMVPLNKFHHLIQLIIARYSGHFNPLLSWYDQKINKNYQMGFGHRKIKEGVVGWGMNLTRVLFISRRTS